jgi:hypothetical protein
LAIRAIETNYTLLFGRSKDAGFPRHDLQLHADHIKYCSSQNLKKKLSETVELHTAKEINNRHTREDVLT